MNKRERQKAETRADILEIAEKLFSCQGFEKTSIQQIADRCGMTKGALYHHFDSKEELLEKICSNHYSYLLEKCEPIIALKELHWLKRVAAILGTIKQANMEKLRFAQEYLKVRKSEESGQLGERLAGYDRKFYITVFGPIFEEARTSGEATFSGSSDIIALFIYNLDKAVTSEIALILEESKADEIEQKITVVLETFVHTLTAMLGVTKEQIEEIIKIPETTKYFMQLVSSSESNNEVTE